MNSRVWSGPVSPLLRTLCGPHLTQAKIQSPRGPQGPEQLAPLPPTLLLTRFLQPHRPPHRSSNTPNTAQPRGLCTALPSAFTPFASSLCSHTTSCLKRSQLLGTSLVVQWLRLLVPNARGWGLIPGQGTRSQVPQLRIHMPQLKPDAGK